MRFHFVTCWAISSSSRHKKGCQMLERLFRVFHYSRNIPWLAVREEEKLSREIRSVAPTISNAIITTRATSSAAAHVKSGSSSGSETSATASEAASDMTNGDLAGSVKPTEHEIVYYKTCLACREQQDLCKVLKNLIFFGCFFSPLS